MQHSKGLEGTCVQAPESAYRQEILFVHLLHYLIVDDNDPLPCTADDLYFSKK